MRNTSRVEGLTKLGVELNYCDLSEIRTLKNAIKDGEVVYHLAALVSDWGPKNYFTGSM